MSDSQMARFKPGDNVPGFASAQVTAGRFVRVTGDKTDQGDYPIAHCALGQKAFGVAERTSLPPSAPAHALMRRVNVTRRGSIARVTAGAALTAPIEVGSDATGRAIEVVDGGAVATLNTGVVANNNAITWTANDGGAAGNDLTITLVDPSANSQSLSVDVDGNDIIVSLATSSGGAITSTPATIIAAIHEHDTASQLVTPSNTGASTGASAVVAVAKTNLAGGADEGYVAGMCLTDAAQAGDIVEVDLY